MKIAVALLVSVLAPACAFRSALLQTPRRPLGRTAALRGSGPSFDPLDLASSPSWDHEEQQGESSFPLMSAAALATLVSLPGSAVAKGGEYGIMEGRIVSLAHPVVMGVCFLVSLGASYTGFQWRRIRALQSEAADLKTALQSPKAALERLEAMDSESRSASDNAKMAALKSEINMLDMNLNEKVEARKKLVSLNFRDRHWALGSVLLGFGVSFAIEGPVNTFMRAGKLFPGPHLYAGAGCTALWALAAAMVPEMQKGKDWARSTHIGLNVLSTALFAYYQIPTGLQIATKVIENTKFP